MRTRGGAIQRTSDLVESSDDIFSVAQSQNIAVSGQKLLLGQDAKENKASKSKTSLKSQKLYTKDERDASYDYAYYDFGDQGSDVFDFVTDFSKTDIPKKPRV